MEGGNEELNEIIALMSHEWLMGLIASIVVAFLTAYWTARNAEKKIRAELKLEYSIEAAIKSLLSNPSYQKRSLKKIKHHLRGFESDNELRMALIRSGAVAFSGSGDDEMWGLIDKNKKDFK